MTCVTRQRLQRQKEFILDGVAADTIGSGYAHILPKLWSPLPPYNAQLDVHAASYFSSPVVKALLKKTEQVKASGSWERNPLGVGSLRLESATESFGRGFE
uniref:Uncharacterized protein n=1 Tax=Sphaerodactylus townsendi TaxID=933632 RepID=A0ACB8EU30_9SAUR